MAMESTMDEVSARKKKNSRVSLCFSYLKFLKQPYLVIQRSGRVVIVVIVFVIVVVIVVADLKVENKMLVMVS
jgi:hypothetical protein